MWRVMSVRDNNKEWSDESMQYRTSYELAMFLRYKELDALAKEWWRRIRTRGRRQNSWLLWRTRTNKGLDYSLWGSQKGTFESMYFWTPRWYISDAQVKWEVPDLIKDTQLCLLCMKTTTSLYSITDWESGFWTGIVQIWGSQIKLIVDRLLTTIE